MDTYLITATRPGGSGDGEEEESEAAELHALQGERSHGDPQAQQPKPGMPLAI